MLFKNDKLNTAIETVEYFEKLLPEKARARFTSAVNLMKHEIDSATNDAGLAAWRQKPEIDFVDALARGESAK